MSEKIACSKCGSVEFEVTDGIRRGVEMDQRRAAPIIRGLLRNCSDWGDDDSISSAINDEERAILTAARDYLAEAEKVQP